MVLLMAFQENYRKSFIRNNRVKKISNEPVAVTKRATSGSDGVSRLGLGLETRLETHFCESRSRRF